MMIIHSVELGELEARPLPESLSSEIDFAPYHVVDYELVKKEPGLCGLTYNHYRRKCD